MKYELTRYQIHIKCKTFSGLALFICNQIRLKFACFFLIMFIFQFVVSVFVLRMFLCETRSTKFIVAAGLAQVSEFSFVLGSRARRFHLISREVRFKECTDNGCVWRVVSNLLSKTESKANKDMKKIQENARGNCGGNIGFGLAF